jgi:hypothetical protein
MIASSLERLRAEFGPCPGCPNGMVDLWIRHEKDIQTCLLLLWKKSKAYQIVQCTACDFSMGVDDYHHLQRSTTAWGVEAISQRKRMLIDSDSESLYSEITGDTSPSDNSSSGRKDNGSTSYVSFAELLECDKKDDSDSRLRICRCCEGLLQESFRFCPKCGMFVDSICSDTSV